LNSFGYTRRSLSFLLIFFSSSVVFFAYLYVYQMGVGPVHIATSEGGIKPIVWIPFIAHTRDRKSADILKASGVPLCSTGYYAFRCLKAIQNFALFDFEDIPVSLPDKKPEDFVSLSEYDSLCFLQDNGIPIIPPLAIAATPEKTIEEAAKLGYPLACKVHSADIQHKSDAGGVKLNIKSPKELEEAWHSIMASAAEKCPKARVEGVLVRPMLKPGVEMIVGVNNDKQFGPTVMIGMGGVFVELFKDVQLAVAPLSKKQAAQMIKRLKAFPLLNGYRGSKPCNIDALASLLVKVSEIAAANKNTIKELDINPVFVNDEGVGIADALLIKTKEN
jgi:acetyltransferase